MVIYQNNNKQGVLQMNHLKTSLILILALIIFACSDKSSDDHIAAAKTYITQKNYNAASIELKNAIKQTPELAEARFLLGKVYLQLRQYENAEKEFNRALKYNYPANEVVPLLSKSYQRTGANNALIKLSHKQKGLTTAQATQVAFYKVQAFVRLNQENKAKKLIKEVKSFKTNSPFKALILVYSLLLDNELNKNNKTAMLQLDNILAKHPQQADALKLKANMLLSEKNVVQATEIYRQYVNYYPDDIEAAFIFARLLTDANKSAEAEPIIDKLLAINSKNMLLNQLKGLARFTAKDYKNALIFTEKAIQENPNDTASRLVAGISAYMEKNYLVANQHLSFIADKLPPSHEALRLLAASQLQLGLTLDANDTLTKFDHITSKDSSLFSSVGLALVESGEVVKAKQILKQAPKIDKAQQANAQELARLGLLKLSLNDVSGVINLENALKQAQSNAKNDDESADKNSADKASKVIPIQQTLATAYLSSGQFDKALALAKHWKEEKTNNSQAYFIASLAYIKQGKTAQAKAELEQLAKLEPQNVKAKMALLSLNARKNTAKENTATLNNILKINPDYVPALMQLYALAKQQGNSKAAIQNVLQRIKQRIKSAPNNIALQITLAKIYLNEQNYNQATDILAAVKVQNEQPAPFWAMLGQSYVQQKHYQKAKNLYQEWLKKQPNNRTAMLGNIVAMDAEGKFKQALTLTQKYLARRGEDPQILLLQSYLLVMNNQFEQAQQSYDKLPKALLELPFSKGVLGQLQLHNNENTKALNNLQIAYQATPNSRNARLIMITFYRLKQQTQGQNFLSAHVQKHPQDQASLMQLANEQLQQDTASAMTSYKTAVKLNPNNGVAQNNLAFLYMQQGKLDLALQHAENALKIMPNDENVLDTLGQIYLLKNDNKNALNYLNKAVTSGDLAQGSTGDEIYLNYINALLLNGQVELAQRKIAQRNITDKKSQLKLSLLKEKYRLKN